MSKFYSLKNILTKNAQYNVVFGERSNGKTYAWIEYAVTQYWKTHKQTALIRRWDTDIIGKRGSVMCDSLVSDGKITKITKGAWTGIHYYASKWYLARQGEDGKRETDDTPFCYGFSLSAMEHDKSTSYPEVTTVVFDEFISRSGYLPDEFVLFCNVLSTIIRQRKDVKIFMFGNTVSKYACPYFREMGLSHVKTQKEGTIDIYRYGNSELIVAVERTAPTKEGKDSDLYFAFDNPKLQMITSGAWDIGIYPHCPCKYRPSDVVYQFFIDYEGTMLHAEVVSVPELAPFIFIHPKTTPVRNDGIYITFGLEFTPDPLHRRDITRPSDTVTRKIAEIFKADRVFFSDNDTGELVYAYLAWCRGEHDE